MDEVMTNVVTFMAAHAAELIVGFAILLMSATLILLIVLIRRKPEDVITKLQDSFTAVGKKQEYLENVIKEEITLNRQYRAPVAHVGRFEPFPADWR